MMNHSTYAEIGMAGNRLEVEPRAGFALALVVLLLFAIGVAGATGYQIVHSEWRMVVQNNEGQGAMVFARAGLQRFMAEQVGDFADTVTYSLSGGDAIVAARKVADVDDFSSMYLLSSEGVYSDPGTSLAPARRTVNQYAVHKETPVDWLAAITQSSGSLTVDDQGQVDGTDSSSSGDCPDGDGPAIVGIARGGDAISFRPQDVDGSADSVSYGSHAGVLSALDLSWSTLTDPNFPVDFQGVWAGGIPVDSFPVVRFNGDKTGYGWTGGRGLLIVTGTFSPRWDFTWEGVILTSHFSPKVGGSSSDSEFTIDGAVISGLDGLGAGTVINEWGTIEYHRCNVIEALGALAHFRPVGNTWWESM